MTDHRVLWSLYRQALREIASRVDAHTVTLATRSTLTLYPELGLSSDVRLSADMCAEYALKTALHQALRLKPPCQCTLKFHDSSGYTEAERQAITDGANAGLKSHFQSELVAIFTARAISERTAYSFATLVVNDRGMVTSFLKRADRPTHSYQK